MLFYCIFSQRDRAQVPLLINPFPYEIIDKHFIKHNNLKQMQKILHT